MSGLSTISSVLGMALSMSSDSTIPSGDSPASSAIANTHIATPKAHTAGSLPDLPTDSSPESSRVIGGLSALGASARSIQAPAPDFSQLTMVRKADYDSSDKESIWSSSTSEFTATTVESDPHEPSRIEAHLYYAGLRLNGRGPKLVYRDSSDVYEEPSGPEEYKRLMRLVAVPDDHEFGKDGLWDRVRDKVRGLLVTQQLLA